MELKDTIKMMQSEDYKERFVAEYEQLKTRKSKLENTISKHDTGTLDFELACPVDILRTQAVYMGLYLDILKKRAEIENIEIQKMMKQDGKVNA